MEALQELEWLEAQRIVITEDLVSVAKQQLQFLAAVDRNRCLYEGPVLQRAISRYNACWLPLLAKHSDSQISEGPLVVPLDCEWIWHCHRLNPVRYKSDCEQLFGKILDNYNILSSVQRTSKEETEQIWNKLYPEEPYELDYSKASSDNVFRIFFVDKRFTKYDLVAAVQRQVPFTYQVSRPHMSNDIFLQGAAARYKGFLHLIKRNKQNSTKCFCVPTYDIDLIWHSHQLNPAAYCKDLTKAVGYVLEHDDTDSDRTKGKKLDVGFFETTGQWERTFGLRYRRAGAMYRGSAPSPLSLDYCLPDNLMGKAAATNEWKEIVQLSQKKCVEVFVEIVGVKNIAEEDRRSLFVFLAKTQPDIFFDAKQRLTVSESRNKQVASFQCEPTGELLFELISQPPSKMLISKPFKEMGSTAISIEELLDPTSVLSVEKWLELMPSSGNAASNPISLRIAVSVTVPVMASYVLRMVPSRPCFKNSCFPLPGRIQNAKRWTCMIDEAGNEVIRLQMRDLKKAQESGGKDSISSKIVGITNSGETHILAEFVGNEWSIMGSQWSVQLQPRSTGGHIFSLKGSTTVMFFAGRKMEYERRWCGKHKNEQKFITAVEMSGKYPYVKAVALINQRSGILEVKEEWFVLPGIVTALILMKIGTGHEACAVTGGVVAGIGGGCGGGACNGDCVGMVSGDTIPPNSCKDECPKVVPLSINDALAAG